VFDPYRIIPPSRSAARWWNWIIWAGAGNDADGCCGERSWVPTYGYTIPEAGRVSLRQFVRWWVRNPCANLMQEVLVWRRDTVLVIYEAPPRRWFYWRPPTNWVQESPAPQVVVVAYPPFFSWRVAGWEGYVGFRSGGEIGAAFRRA
jgi:hypothetical protein